MSACRGPPVLAWRLTSEATMKCVSTIPSAGAGSWPSLALQHRAHLDGPAEPGDRDPCREGDRRVEP